MGGGERLSVVIPSWREGPELLNAVRAARERLGPCEIVVAAAEEDPAIRKCACDEGVRWVDAPRPCRGLQLRLGAAAAAGDVLVFLHVDSRLPQGAAVLVHAALAGNGVAGGAFRLAFDQSHPALALLTALSRLTLTTSFLGDQAFFCTRRAYLEAGGFRDLPLFEDVEFARRLAGMGRLVRLPRAVVTSARRFTRNGPVRQLLSNAVMMAAYHAGVPPERLSARYDGAQRR